MASKEKKVTRLTKIQAQDVANAIDVEGIGYFVESYGNCGSDVDPEWDALFDKARESLGGMREYLRERGAIFEGDPGYDKLGDSPFVAEDVTEAILRALAAAESIEVTRVSANLAIPHGADSTDGSTVEIAWDIEIEESESSAKRRGGHRVHAVYVVIKRAPGSNKLEVVTRVLRSVSGHPRSDDPMVKHVATAMESLVEDYEADE